MNGIDHTQINIDFSKKFERMLALVARGRGIEILLRIAHQTAEGLESVDESYKSMMSSALKMQNPHPKNALKIIFQNEKESARVELARDIADKLAHGLYQLARSLIDKYKNEYGLKAKLNNAPYPGLKIMAEGHLIEEDGQRIISIIDELTTSPDNLIIEEFDIFLHNNYGAAAEEVFNDAWKRIASTQSSLASEVARLQMFRGFKRGKRTYESAQPHIQGEAQRRD